MFDQPWSVALKFDLSDSGCKSIELGFFCRTTAIGVDHNTLEYVLFGPAWERVLFSKNCALRNVIITPIVK